MASCQTSRWVSTAPYAKLTVTQSSSTDTAVTYDWTLQYIADSAANTNGVGRAYTVKIGGTTVKNSTYNINGVSGTKMVASGSHTVSKTTSAQTVSFSVSFAFNITWSGTYGGTKSASGTLSVPAKTSYKISYSANGGTGAPAAQTKWYGTALKLSTAKPTRSGYSFQGWATSASGGVTYASGASYTANATVTLYAVWKANTYTVSYNANGGTGAPSSQTKTYGVALKLSTVKPTRTNYTFKGWGITASATTVAYSAGGSYTKDAAITLYAVWELSYKKPTISNLSASRCGSDGIADESGTYALVKFKWSTYQEIAYISIRWTDASGNTNGSTTIDASGTSGTAIQVVGDGAFDSETSYSFTVTAADGDSDANKTERSVTMSGVEFHIDFAEHAVAIGKPAEPLLDSNGNVENTFDVDWRSRFRNNVGVGDKMYYHDGKQGIFLSWEGFMHLQRTSAQGYHPYIAFYVDDETSPSGLIRLNSETRSMEFINADTYKFNSNVELNSGLKFVKNSTTIYGVDQNGLVKNAFQAQNENGNTIVGHGNYSNASGSTNIYGHDINFGVSNIPNPGTYRPYRRRGDTITISIRTSGYVTNGGADVSFWIPFSVPIIGSPTVTLTSGSGFTLRQGGQYTHGSTANATVTPSSYEATAVMFSGVYVKATFSNTSNVINNDSIGIYWNGTITFS